MKTAWSIYKAEARMDFRAVQTPGLIAEPVGDDWWAIYRREGDRAPAVLVGLRRREVSAADLTAAGDREKGRPRDDYDAEMRDRMKLLHCDDAEAPDCRGLVDMDNPPFPSAD